MIFSSKFDRRKVNPLIFIKFWRQACLPTLLYGVELFTLTSSLLKKLERCQMWYLKNIFFVPKFASNLFLLKLSGLNSVESEVALKKLLFLGRLLTNAKMAPIVQSLFKSRSESFFDDCISSIGSIPSIVEALCVYDLLDYFESWFSKSIFPTYVEWKTIVKTRIRKMEEIAWKSFCQDHTKMHIAQACLDNKSPYSYWAIANQYPDLVSRLHIQVRLMGNFGLNGGIPWLCGTDGAVCFICKEGIETVNHFVLDCNYFRENFELLWTHLTSRIINYNPSDGIQIAEYITNLDRHHRVLLLLGGLSLPFDTATITVITKFISSAVYKIYNLRIKRLRDMEAPWLT